MSDHFDLYQYSNNLFEAYPPADSDWLQQGDSGQPFIKISHGSYGSDEYISDPEEKVCGNTGISLHEEFALGYGSVRDSPRKQEAQLVQIPPQETLPSLPADIENRPRTQKRQIDISTGAICRKSRVARGDRFQTKNLCKHLHTETANFLKDSMKVRQFESEEVEAIRAFCQSKISIDCFKTLLKHPGIGLLVGRFYESRYYLRDVLTSRMEMRAKLTMIKYLERIRSIAYDRNFKTWKKEGKEFQ